MKSKSLTTTRIACTNLKSKAGRTASLVLVVAVLAFTLFGGLILTQSLNNGMRSLEARLGADIAVVPQGREDDYHNIVLDGLPANFHFDSAIEQRVAEMPGVSQVTAQFFVATLSEATCCIAESQVVGVDFDTDFVVTPWMERALGRDLGAFEAIVGSNVPVDSNNTVTFFDHTPLNVASRLARTATGMDNSVFVRINTARQVAMFAQAKGYAFEGVDIPNSISALMVNVYDSDEIVTIADYIRRNVDGVGVVVSSAISDRIASTLNLFTSIFAITTIVFGIIAILLLGVLFSLIANSRKKEFAIIRTMGATRKKLASMVLVEGLIISIIGAVIGTLLAGAVVFPFARMIGTRLGMPLLLPSFWVSAGWLGVSLAASIAIGPLATGYSAFRISRAETYATMREGE